MSPAIAPIPLLAAALLTILAPLQESFASQGVIGDAAERVVVDSTLSQRAATLQAINAESVQMRDPEGRLFTLTRRQVLALLPPLTDRDSGVANGPARSLSTRESNRAGQGSGRLELTDGQVLPGSLAKAIVPAPGEGAVDTGTSADAERLTWDSTLWGLISVPLEHVRSISFQPEKRGGEYVDPLREDGATEDVVFALNGDRLQGFVSSVSAVVRIQQGGVASDLPIGRVSNILFANPSTPPRGAWIWLHDGDTVAVSTISASDPDHVSVTGAIEGVGVQPVATLTTTDIRALSFDTHLLRPLAALAFKAVATPEPGPTVTGSGWLSRRWTPPPVVGDVRRAPLGAADIELPGPMSVEWQLHTGAGRVGAHAELPPDCRGWGDCELVFELVTNGGVTPLSRHRLTGATPSAQVNVQLPEFAAGASLRITVEAGPSGPIQDRVTLRRALVLVGP